MSKAFAVIFGLVLVVLGVLGFASVRIAGSTGYFATNHPHDVVHILLGLILLFGYKKSSASLKFVALVCLLIAIAGFVIGPGKLFNFLLINQADNWLHLGLAVVLFACSMAGSSNPSSMPQLKQPPF